jgi:hypothetical protein
MIVILVISLIRYWRRDYFVTCMTHHMHSCHLCTVPSQLLLWQTYGMSLESTQGWHSLGHLLITNINLHLIFALYHIFFNQEIGFQIKCTPHYYTSIYSITQIQLCINVSKAVKINKNLKVHSQLIKERVLSLLIKVLDLGGWSNIDPHIHIITKNN